MAATTRLRTGNSEIISDKSGQLGRDEMIAEFDRWMQSGGGCCAKVIFRGVVIMAGRSFTSKACGCARVAASK